MRSKTAYVRMAMALLADTVVVYTYTQKRELQEKWPKMRIKVAPNSLYAAKEYGFDPDSERVGFIYVGRIVPEKKVDLLIRAFAKAKQSHSEIILHIVGDGPELEEIVRLVEREELAGSVILHGHVGEVARLRELYKTCVAAVSPGYVGLSATQSFSFGVPMLVADSEPHAPEIEAVEQDFNARFFRSDSVESLATEMRQIYQNRESWHRLGQRISDACRDTYSAESMASGLIQAIEAEV